MSIAAFAIMGLVAVVVGFLLLLITPNLQYIALGIIGLGIVLLSSAFIIEFRTVKGAFASKRGKFSTSTTILVSVFAGIILLVNAISVWKYHRFDFTGISQFTLTSQTKDVLTRLDEPVDVLRFFVPTDTTGARDYAQILLTEYSNLTTKLIITPVIDPEQNPEKFREYFQPYLSLGIPTEYLYPSLIFKTSKGQRLVGPAEILTGAEHAFTSAILEVTGIEQRKIYFLTGHGEVDPESTDATGYSKARDGLKDNLFKVATLDLVASPAIPKDLAVLVIAAPKSALLDSEKQIIADYLKNNGSVLFMVDPDSPGDIAQLIAPWGIKIEKGAIVEPKSYSSPSKSAPLVDRTRNSFGYNTLYFPGAVALSPTAEPPVEVEAQAMVISTADSWIETDMASLDNPKYDEGVDKKGAQVIAAFISGAVKSSDNQGNPTEYYDAPLITVIGDSDFANNKNFINGQNGDLFLNIINRLGIGKDIITIDRKVLQTRRLILSPEKERFLEISSIALLPAIVLIIGVVIWWRRR